ncbi:MAG: UbiA family prenyltransferase [Acidimicrobiia bacterium]|nr:UbiA family prenyltransferase [Acidimicrobiia bacterium]
MTSVLLPLGYVAVPYLLGAFSVDVTLNRRGVLLLVGLYLGFMGRLVLKDFRDEHGDRMYSKRTMLVRYGRARTCAFGAVFWTAGGLVGLLALATPPVLTVVTLAYVAVVLVMLRDIARDRDPSHGGAAPNRDVANIAAIAVIGRALVYTFVIQMVVETAQWAPWAQAAMIAVTALASLGMARECRAVLSPVTDPLTDAERVSLPAPGVDGAEADAREAPAASTRGVFRPDLALGGGGRHESRRRESARRVIRPRGSHGRETRGLPGPDGLGSRAARLVPRPEGW